MEFHRVEKRFIIFSCMRPQDQSAEIRIASTRRNPIKMQPFLIFKIVLNILNLCWAYLTTIHGQYHLVNAREFCDFSNNKKRFDRVEKQGWFLGHATVSSFSRRNQNFICFCEMKSHRNETGSCFAAP